MCPTGVPTAETITQCGPGSTPRAAVVGFLVSRQKETPSRIPKLFMLFIE